MVDPEIAMRLPGVKSPSQIPKFCVIELNSFSAMRRRADRTMTLSQIVHLRAPSHEYALRCKSNRTLILITSAA
jgi:hypothetical protein